MKPDILLQISGLRAGYGDIEVLRGIDLEITTGARVGLFGPNGHGKSTLLEVVSGLLRPWSGEIRYKGRSIINLNPGQIVEEGLIHVPQGNVLFPRMSVMENLSAGAYLKKAQRHKKSNLEKVFSYFPVLAERRNQTASTLSGGERQMLAIAAGLMGNGQAMMLDEPTLGLSPKIRHGLAQVIRKIAGEGMTILLVEQDYNFMSLLVEQFYMIEEGRVAFKSRPDDMELEEIRQMYFGGSVATASC